jgi:Tol biopolymer transport system component
MRSLSPRCLLTLTVVLAAVLSLGGCSSSSTTASSPEPEQPEPAGPGLSFLYTTADDGLVLDAAADSARPLVPDATHNGPRALAPSGRRLAFTYTAADSTHLALLDLTTGTLQPVHARATPVTYSLAWHPAEDRLAFAYYEPARSGTRGPGDVFVAASDGSTRDVGCSAAREVLDWLPNGGGLATRNDDKLYVVAPSDCGTRAAADARRMRLAAYAPTGNRLAYIHRELTYDRDANEYTPDSSLYLSDPEGQNATTLFGPERRVRHLQWAPDGSELAFDVRVEDSGHRQIAIYGVARDRTVFLIPPNAVRADQRHPRWSPQGTHVAFTRGTGPDATAATRVEGQTRTLGPVDGAVWGWLDDRTVVVPGPDSLRIQSLGGATRHTRPAPATLVHVWRRDPA